MRGQLAEIGIFGKLDRWIFRTVADNLGGFHRSHNCPINYDNEGTTDFQRSVDHKMMLTRSTACEIMDHIVRGLIDR